MNYDLHTLSLNQKEDPIRYIKKHYENLFQQLKNRETN